jgi:hypothetical protein
MPEAEGGKIEFYCRQDYQDCGDSKAWKLTYDQKNDKFTLDAFVNVALKNGEGSKEVVGGNAKSFDVNAEIANSNTVRGKIGLAIDQLLQTDGKSETERHTFRGDMDNFTTHKGDKATDNEGKTKFDKNIVNILQQRKEPPLTENEKKIVALAKLSIGLWDNGSKADQSVAGKEITQGNKQLRINFEPQILIPDDPKVANNTPGVPGDIPGKIPGGPSDVPKTREPGEPGKPTVGKKPDEPTPPKREYVNFDSIKLTTDIKPDESIDNLFDLGKMEIEVGQTVDYLRGDQVFTMTIPLKEGGELKFTIDTAYNQRGGQNHGAALLRFEETTDPKSKATIAMLEKNPQLAAKLFSELHRGLHNTDNNQSSHWEKLGIVENNKGNKDPKLTEFRDRLVNQATHKDGVARGTRATQAAGSDLATFRSDYLKTLNGKLSELSKRSGEYIFRRDKDSFITAKQIELTDNVVFNQYGNPDYKKMNTVEEERKGLNITYLTANSSVAKKD